MKKIISGALICAGIILLGLFLAWHSGWQGQIPHATDSLSQTPSTKFAPVDPALALSDAEHVETLDVAEATTYLRQISEDKGGAYGYQVLGKISPKWNTYIHMFGHVIGAELYKQQGLRGMAVCTTDFAFSCYHSILGAAVAEEGIRAVRDINQVCVESKDLWACQHGLGHGIMATVGYDDPFKALEVCAGLSDQSPINGCIQGVFMEHNSLTMLDPAMHKQRELTDTGLYYPCDTVADEYKNECYHEIPVWWRGIYGQENYKKIASLCEGVPNQENKNWCFRRLGSLIIEPPLITASTSIAACKAALPLGSALAYCVQSIQNELPGGNNACESLEPTDRAVCQEPIPAMVYTKEGNK